VFFQQRGKEWSFEGVDNEINNYWFMLSGRYFKDIPINQTFLNKWIRTIFSGPSKIPAKTKGEVAYKIGEIRFGGIYQNF